MNFMDLAKQAATGVLGNDNMSGNAITIIMQLIEKNGGIANIIQQFNTAGLGDVVQSWIGNGQNLPISADQLLKVFGNSQLEGIAKQFNINTSDITSMLSTVLPQTVDKMTPNGEVGAQMPDMSQLMELGKSFFGK